jgi:hypothetical protein
VAFRYLPGVVALAFAFVANAANCQSRGASARPAPGVQPHFVCNTGYSAELCRRQMEVLRGVLAVNSCGCSPAEEKSLVSHERA